MSSSHEPLYGFGEKITKCFFFDPFLNIAQTVRHNCTTWAPKLKNRKKIITFLTNPCMDFVTVPQICSLTDPLHVLLQLFCSAANMFKSHRASGERFMDFRCPLGFFVVVMFLYLTDNYCDTET